VNEKGTISETRLSDPFRVRLHSIVCSPPSHSLELGEWF
jgi:hypothetical protein